MIIHTDASLCGWGGGKIGELGGRWNGSECEYHINVLELLAIFHALKAFQEQLQTKHVKIFSDNTTAVSYINTPLSEGLNASLPPGSFSV